MRTGMTHTPGPWQVDSGMVQTVRMVKRSGFDVHIPIAYMDREAGNGTIPVERDANAHLIAAAPELLEALQMAEATIVRLNRHDSANGTLDVVRAAIAKAEERQ